MCPAKPQDRKARRQGHVAVKKAGRHLGRVTLSITTSCLKNARRFTSSEDLNRHTQRRVCSWHCAQECKMGHQSRGFRSQAAITVSLGGVARQYKRRDSNGAECCAPEAQGPRVQYMPNQAIFIAGHHNNLAHVDVGRPTLPNSLDRGSRDKIVLSTSPRGSMGTVAARLSWKHIRRDVSGMECRTPKTEAPLVQQIDVEPSFRHGTPEHNNGTPYQTSFIADFGTPHNKLAHPTNQVYRRH